MKIFLIIVGFALISELLKFVAKVISDISGKKKLEHEVSMLKDRLDTANRIIASNDSVIQQLRNSQWTYTMNNLYQSERNVSKDEIEAVRYAMKKAHPDNGGNAEDFMRFKKCYEELTRR